MSKAASSISRCWVPANPRVLPMAEMSFEQWPEGKPRIVGYDAKWEEDSSGWNGTVRAFGVEHAEPELAAGSNPPASGSGTCSALPALRGWISASTDEGAPLILEINTNPCISPDAGFRRGGGGSGHCPMTR